MRKALSLIMAMVLIFNITALISAADGGPTECVSVAYSEIAVGEKEPVRIRDELSEGVKNIVKRAMQMTLIRWTPLKDVTGWENFLVYEAGTTYEGLPYGQPIYASYVPWYTSLDDFISKVNDPDSKFYTSKSTYNEVAPYYSVDCSAYVSWAWQMSERNTTSGIPRKSELISSSSYENAQVGDAFCKSYSHVVLITDLAYDESGKINYIEISEATAKLGMDCCCWSVSYGDGCEQSLEDLSAKYFGAGYSLYRNPQRDTVTYTHSCEIPLPGDECSECKAGIYTSLAEVYGSVAITADTAHSYAMPAEKSAWKGEYVRGTRITVTKKVQDALGKIWYKTEDGAWLKDDTLEFYENEFCTVWTEERPVGYNEAYIEEKTIYRTAVKESITSLEASVEGYEKEGTKLVKYNTETLIGITAWPEGFDNESELYKQYDLSYLVPITETDYRRTVSRPSARGYAYYHYCDGENESVSGSQTDTKATLHYFFSTADIEALEKEGEAYLISNKVCTCSNRFYAVPRVALKYNEFRRENVFVRPGEWSEWSDVPAVTDSEIYTEQLTVYRYNDTAHRWSATETVTEADCKNEGVCIYTCDGCGAEKQDISPKTGHTADTAVTVTEKAGLNKEGESAILCKVCGEAMETVKIPAITKTVQGFKTVVYDGTAKTPTIRFYDSEGNRLVYKTDFKVKYPSSRTKPGTYTAKVTFMGKYEGETDIIYTIKPSAVEASASSTKNSVTLTWDDLPEATGYRVFRYNTSTKKYKALKTTWDTTYTDTSLKAGTRYYYVVKSYTKVKGEYYWSSYSKVAINTKK